MIQSEILTELLAAMKVELTDVTYTFTAIGKRGSTTGSYNPITGEAGQTTASYSGELIGGLNFLIRDLEVFAIEKGDQKAILPIGDTDPMIDDKVTFDGNTFKIIDLKKLPANIGHVLQLRRWS